MSSTLIGRFFLSCNALQCRQIKKPPECWKAPGAGENCDLGESQAQHRAGWDQVKEILFRPALLLPVD